MDRYPSATRIILELKSSKGLCLADLSERIGISKMGVLNQIQKLEGMGIIERNLVKSKIGRPHFIFLVKESSKGIIRNSSDLMLDELMNYLIENERGELVENFLRKRYEEVRISYMKKLSGMDPRKRLEALVKLRDDENYFPELNRINNDVSELLEYNCPIYRISNKFGLACSLETSLFSSVLGMDVKATHRQIDGSGLCRFLISKKAGVY